jgi:hypothetical protein
MPSLIGTTVTANYLKAIPSTQFGTRRLSVINVAIANVHTNYANSDSLFSKSVRALQQTAEVWAVFTPAAGAFKAIIATHTQWQGTAAEGAAQKGNIGQDGTADDYEVLEAAILAGNGVPGSAGVAATVTNVSGFEQVAI